MYNLIYILGSFCVQVSFKQTFYLYCIHNIKKTFSLSQSKVNCFVLKREKKKQALQIRGSKNKKICGISDCCFGKSGGGVSSD